MAKPLISVLTPTYNRHDLLIEAIQNVNEQDYAGPIQHVIVSDGPDPGLMAPRTLAFRPNGLPHVERIFVALGRHWTSELDESYAAAPLLTAQLIAAGEIQSWLADDERMAPNYLTTMVDALQESGCDFVYPRVAYYRWDVPGFGVGIGADPPKLGSITTLVYRVSVFNKAKGPYRTHVGRAGDWEFVSRLVEGGATYRFVDQVLFSHRDDRDCPPERYAEPLPEFARVG